MQAESKIINRQFASLELPVRKYKESDGMCGYICLRHLNRKSRRMICSDLQKVNQALTKKKSQIYEQSNTHSNAWFTFLSRVLVETFGEV